EVVPVATYPELHHVLQVAYRGEYGLENDQQSALNLLYLIGSDDDSEFRIFGESDERWHAHDGNDTFTSKLAESLPEGAVRLGHKLVRLSDGGAGGYDLTFESGGSQVSVSATRVVFAL